jgi:hypothetical protein
VYPSRTPRRLGLFLIVAAVTVPAWVLCMSSGTFIPYQDPTPEMQAQYAADVAAADRRLVISLIVGVLLLIAGMALLVRAARRDREK